MTNFAVQNSIARERILLFETLILSCDQPPYSIWDISMRCPFFIPFKAHHASSLFTVAKLPLYFHISKKTLKFLHLFFFHLLSLANDTNKRAKIQIIFEIFYFQRGTECRLGVSRYVTTSFSVRNHQFLGRKLRLRW